MERWKKIPGVSGYEVSDLGRVRGPRGLRRLQGKRYPEFIVRMQYGYRLVRVHQAVLRAFIGPCPKGMEALHWDDDKQNCRLSNLRYGTRQDNVNDRQRNGLYIGVAEANRRRVQ